MCGKKFSMLLLLFLAFSAACLSAGRYLNDLDWWRLVMNTNQIQRISENSEKESANLNLEITGLRIDLMQQGEQLAAYQKTINELEDSQVKTAIYYEARIKDKFWEGVAIGSSVIILVDVGIIIYKFFTDK